MKQPGEELQETVTELDDRAVVDYLLRNPEFFIRNARVVEEMRVPHPVRGTVSLVEWHMARSRNHINQLEENMTLLMEQASTNESLFYRLLHLQARLASAHSLDEFLSRFHRWARELGLAGATIRLFPDRWRIGAPSGFTHLALSRQAFEPLRIQRLGHAHLFRHGVCNGRADCLPADLHRGGAGGVLALSDPSAEAHSAHPPHPRAALLLSG